MKKLLTTLALTLGLLFGGVAFLAPAASAAECQPFTPCDPFTQPDPPTLCPPFTSCTPTSTPFAGGTSERELYLSQQLVDAEQTANEYRAQVVALTAKVERIQRVADRRAATIQRLRAVIRALR